MDNSQLEASVRSLFVSGELGVFTCAAGYSNAKFDQYTELSRHLHSQMLKVLDVCEIEYFLFAGSMVGYVRNRAMPYWMDDLDIIILEDAIPRFEERALPILREIGYNCFAQEHNIGAGFHILAMQQGNSRALSIPLSSHKDVSVPWAQIDAFYTTVNEDGFLRNPTGWGMYHSKDVPHSWVRPGCMVQFGDMEVRAFSKFEEDIQLEYGDVLNNIVIHNHSTTYLSVPNTPWQDFEKVFLSVLSETTTDLPETIMRSDVDSFKPQRGCVYTALPEESFSEISSNVIKQRAEVVKLSHGDQTFWAMDLKRLFPELLVHAIAENDLQAQRAAQLFAFVDHVECKSDAVQAEYSKCLTALQHVLNSGADKAV